MKFRGAKYLEVIVRLTVDDTVNYMFVAIGGWRT